MTLEDMRMTVVERVSEWPKQWLREDREQGLREGCIEQGLEQGIEQSIERGRAEKRALLERRLRRGYFRCSITRPARSLCVHFAVGVTTPGPRNLIPAGGQP